MSGMAGSSAKASTLQREAYFLGFAEQVRTQVKTPLMVTGGFRTFEGMNTALASGALDIVGIARLMAIEPDAPKALLNGRDCNHQVQPISTGIKAIDKMGVMEILWYSRQLKRIAEGNEPKPKEGGLWAFLASLLKSIWGTSQTKRLRA